MRLRQLVKEFRALLPLWAASMAVLALTALAEDGIDEFAVLAYIAGSLALGSHTLGHEYGHRTLPILLAQPVSRGRLLVTKAAAVLPLLLTLAAGFWFFVGRDLTPRPPLGLILLPIAAGMFGAPLLTILTRNQMGGIMLTAMIAGMTFVATQVLTAKMSGLATREVEQLALTIWQRMMYATCAAAALLVWPVFRRLEAIDGGGAEIHFPSWARAEGVRRGHPLWVTVRKELRIQQLTFLMAGLFVAGETVRYLLTRSQVIRPPDGVADVLIPVYFGIVALVAGSLASAEERQYGVAEAQLLLPMSAARQWTIKAGVTIAVAILLGGGLPLLMRLAVWGGEIRHARAVVITSALAIAVLAACALYVSSLSTNTVRALVLAGPFALGLQLLAVSIMELLPVRSTAPFIVAMTVGLLLIIMAGANHRRLDRSWRRVAWQLAGAAAVIVVGIPLLSELLHLTLP